MTDWLPLVVAAEPGDGLVERHEDRLGRGPQPEFRMHDEAKREQWLH
ncbi:hypothetical protein [Candidatus Rariloculus sp.]